jgi:hypothetical protein
MTIVACSSNDASETSIDGNNYNKTALFDKLGDNIIIPSYVNYQAKLAILATGSNF